MKEYFEYFCCPCCHGDLSKEADFLLCLKCGQKYEVKKDIPILVDLNNLPKHLVNQIKYFEIFTKDNLDYQVAYWQQAYLEKFWNAFTEINSDKVIIDCGTGSGYMTIELAKLGTKIITCDLTLKSLIRLKNIAENLGLSSNIIFVCCSAEKLPFKDKIADYFVSNAVLEHLPKEKKAVAEIDRVTKNNAGLMITVPLSYKYLNLLLIPINYIHDKKIGHLRRYSKELLEKKFFTWKLIKCYYTGHFNKVLKVLINIFYPFFNKKNIEVTDKKKENKKWGASNIIIFFKK